MAKILPRLAVSLLGMAFCGTCTELSQFIQSFGYTELRPPSTIMAPGTMVVVRGTHPFEGKIVCSAEESLGKDIRLIRSATTRSSVLRKKSFGVNFEASLLEEVKGDARYDDLDDASLEFSNAQIVTLEDSEVERAAQNRTEDCRRAIARRIAQGYDVTMISSVIAGDMVIRATWKKDSKIDASAKIETLQHLALEFGQEAADAGENVISAKGLIWGVSDDKFLAALTIERDVISHEALAAIPRKERAIRAPAAALAARPKGKMALVEHGASKTPIKGIWRRQREAADEGVAPTDILSSHTDMFSPVSYEDGPGPDEFSFTPPNLAREEVRPQARKLKRYDPSKS